MQRSVTGLYSKENIPDNHFLFLISFTHSSATDFLVNIYYKILIKWWNIEVAYAVILYDKSKCKRLCQISKLNEAHLGDLRKSGKLNRRELNGFHTSTFKTMCFLRNHVKIQRATRPTFSCVEKTKFQVSDSKNV